jgi:RimJ/RimL family protein N-acetyltransferase
MSLITERLILRPWRDSDLEPFARLNADPFVMEFMPRCLSRDESDAFAARIRADMERRGWGLWAVEVKGGPIANEHGEPGAAGGSGATGPIGKANESGSAPFIGYVGLSVPSFDAHFTPCVEIGWRLAKEHWGRGYATEAAVASLRFAFERLTLERIVAFTVPPNRRSIGVMERIGMTRDAADDFEHPKLPPGHPLRRHVLYTVNRR